MNQWRFPHGEGLTPTGVNNTSIEIFLDNIADSLTREVIQNSLDAHNPEISNPVKVEFDFYEVKTSTIPGIDRIKNFALTNAFKMWRKINNTDTLSFLERFEKVLNEETISVLKISDYNTKGLNQKNYESLVLGNAYSEKDNENSAGSKGIGKAAPFAASDLRMVFYNTVPTNDTPKSAGVMNFVSFEFDEEGKQITQERATYFEEGKNFIPNQLVFETAEREEDQFGTDIYILGLKQFEESWTERILLSIVDSFLISIMNNELEVMIDDKIINHSTLATRMEELKELNLKGDEKAVFNSTLNYYDVMTNPNSIKRHLDSRFKEYPFCEKPEDATLYLLQHEPANRTVLQTRKVGMKIYERNRISGNINFTGVFQATGNKLDAFLKDMENANHNTWSIDRMTGKDRKLAEKLLSDLLRWYKDEAKGAYEVTGETNIEAFGVSDLLPLNEGNNDKNDKKDSGIKNKIENIKIKKKTRKSDLTAGNGDDEDKFLERTLEEAGIGHGDESGQNARGGKNGGGQGGHHGLGDNKGNKGEDSVGDRAVITKEKRVASSGSLSVKILSLNPSEGKYRIVGKANKKAKLLEVALKSVGADGKVYSIKILNSNSQTLSVTHTSNAIKIHNIKKGERINIDFVIKSKLRMKMEGTVYEIKG
ncbi:hypothetical protein ACN7UQ_09760 [Aerococcus urinaeequi]|uniref:hypothetical protein n=1 Tax=Aerococcus urinaeequi TaxID=51665 RepID=UPI003B3B0A77